MCPFFHSKSLGEVDVHKSTEPVEAEPLKVFFSKFLLNIIKKIMPKVFFFVFRNYWYNLALLISVQILKVPSRQISATCKYSCRL